jgi:DNA-binding NtrC family response regulator
MAPFRAGAAAALAGRPTTPLPSGMPASILVLQRSESFAEIWSPLASPHRVERIEEYDPAEPGRNGTVCGLIIAAGGVETEAAALVREIRGKGSCPVAVVGASTDYRIGISLVQEGAQNYFALPGDLGALRAWMVSLAETVEQRESAQAFAQENRKLYDFSQIVGRSPGLQDALQRAMQVIPRERATVLLTGETGTGKELFARAIHYNSPRGAKPFVEINCAALPPNLLEAELFGYERGAFTDARTAKPGLFEVADGGTLFLDEIGDLPLDLQGKLLRVLEDKRVRRLGSVRDRTLDIRIVAATHVDLATAIRQGAFRRDLYYRLNLVPIHLPALRQRGEDVLLLAEQFLRRAQEEYAIHTAPLSREFRQALREYAWPGNIRELRNVIERAVLFSQGELRVADLSLEEDAPFPASDSVLPFPAPLAAIERAAARAMVEHCSGNKSRAAKQLGISRRHLYTLLGDE